MRCTLELDQSAELVVGYGAGTLDPDATAAFERHMECCPACREAGTMQKGSGRHWTNGRTWWCRRSWTRRERSSSAEHFLNRTPGEFGGFGAHAHQIQNGGNKTQAIVRLLYLSMLWNAGVGSAGEQQYGVRGRPQERAVIASRIEIADIEVPMIVGEDHEIGLGQTAAALVEARQQCCVRVVRHAAAERWAKTARAAR